MQRFLSVISKTAIAVSLLGFAAMYLPLAHSQAISVNGGSIQGTITDPTGASVPKAHITITGTDTGSVKRVEADGAGYYSVGPLPPGSYTVLISAGGFSQLSVTTVVRTGTATSGNFKLALGTSSETIEVNAGAIQVNTDQVGVSAVITQKQFDQLPVNGRNFLDYAQLQPGVQLQNGDSNAGGFDPTKAGYSALSFSGTSGRTTRILLDGQDITDETVGTTIFNVTSGSVGEMQVNRSVADPSTDITSGGSVYASTRTGTNAYHGQLFYNFQDYRALFATVKGTKPPFQRNQFGGNVGGPIIKDKLFFFASSERIKQDSSAPTTVLTGAATNYFSAIAAAYPNVSTPARDTYSSGRLDYSGPWGVHYFARVNYEANAYITGIDYSLYANRDNVPGIAYGADFQRGKFTHSFRGSYEKFHNFIVPTVSSYNPIPGIYLSFGGQGLRTGFNDNAPQATYQTDKQLRYDGSWTKGSHNIRYGGDLNRILGGGSAAFFGAGPGVYLNNSTSVSRYGGPTASNPNALGCGGVPGAAPCNSDLLNGYHPYYFYLGNNIGVATETPGFGLPGGKQGDWRIGFYVNDSWKITPTFTLSVGARYDRDTGRTDSDLGVIPCSAIVADNFSTVPCSGSTPLLDQFGAGLSGKIAQPNRNVGPQIGFNYAPAALHNKTVFRGAFGIFYESSVFNNNLFERNSRLASGKFNQYNLMCSAAGGQTSLFIPGKGNVSANSAGVSISTMCTEPMAKAVPDILVLENDYKAGAASTSGPNPGFIGNTLYTSAGDALFAPSYRSPYSIDFNFGVQQEISRGVVITADYVHNAGLRIGQIHDANHVGDAAYFNKTAAQNAISATTGPNGYGCTGGYAPAAIDCAIAGGATIADFAGNGLTSLTEYTGGAPITAFGLTPNTGAAFAGVNPLVGTGEFQFPDGKSAYDGLQLNLREQKAHPMRGLSDSLLEVSYAYSRFITSGGAGSSDQFFLPGAYDNNRPSTYMGYGSLDRTNIFSFGGSATLKYGPRIGFIGHFNSAPPTTLTLDTSGNGGAGQIFQTDLTGDGTTGDFLPGTQQGAYMRSIKPDTLNKTISNYNATSAGQLTPAGKTLLSSGLFTQAQLTALGAVTPTLGSAPAYAYPNSAFRQVDITASFPLGHSLVHFLPESFSLEPAIAFYNAFNNANYGGTGGSVLIDSTQTGSVNSPYDSTVRYNSRVTRGIGTFSQGAPRSTEFQLKLNF
ncbi:MAG TPA: carboxypeptidase-like regulatory domain-containing protein [Acidobacteriaceae bacterium]